MVTNLTIALAISLTGQVDDKVCYKKCTGHTDDRNKKGKRLIN